MHRYVALIANSADQETFDRLARRLAKRFADWRCALDGHRAKAWVTATPPSPLGFMSRGPSGCLIGAKLGDRQLGMWDREAGSRLLSNSWGAYVEIQVGNGADITIARDPSGRIPCFTSHLSGADVYFSNIDDVPEAETASTDPIDWDYIHYHLNFIAGRCRQTGLKAVTELLPGRKVQYSGDEQKEASAWPIADIIATPFENPEAAEAGLRMAAAEAVGSWARQYDRITLDLSGGFDSAVVLGLIREQAPDVHILAVNYLSAHPESDERIYAEAAAERHSVPLSVERLSAEGRCFDLHRSSNWLRPTLGALPIGHLDVRNRAAEAIGAQAAFSGNGGDNVFGESVPPSMLAAAVQDRLPISSLFKIAHDYCKMSSETIWNLIGITIVELLGPRRIITNILHSPNPYLLNDAIEGANFERFIHPDLVEVGGFLSSAKLHQIISFHHLNDHYWRFGSEFKPDEVAPLQSQLVIEASLRIPPYWTNSGGRRRGLARRAFRDLVPDIILTRRGKSGTTSHMLQILANNKLFLRDLMLDGYLVNRGLLDKKKLEISLSPQVCLTQFGSLARVISTELWVRCFTARAADPARDSKIQALG